MVSGLSKMNRRQDSLDNNTIGALHFCAFPSSYLLANQLSLRLDAEEPLGRDYHTFLEEFGLDPICINFLGERCGRPTYEALVKILRETSLKEIADVLERIERDDCVRVIRKAILDQVKRKREEHHQDNGIARDDMNADIQTILSWDSTKLLRPQVPRPVFAIGRQSEIASWRIICQHLKVIQEELQQFLVLHVIRKPTDPGIKSTLLALTTTLARLILFFLFANDLILSINVVFPLWSSVHELSIIEHLTVLMLVLSDLVLEPMICALRDIVTEKHVRQVILEKMEKEKKKLNKKGNKRKQNGPETSIRRREFIEKRCKEELEELQEKETKQMRSNRSTYFFIFPIQFGILIVGIYLQYFDVTELSHNDRLYNCCLVLLFLDMFVRIVLIIIHYITLNSADRFNVHSDHLDKKCKKFEEYLKELYQEEQNEKMTPKKTLKGQKSGKRRLGLPDKGNRTFEDKGIQVDTQNAPFSSWTCTNSTRIGRTRSAPLTNKSCRPASCQ